MCHIGTSMIIAPNSPARQKKVEEEAGDRTKGGQTGTPTPGVDTPTGPFLSGVSDARNKRKDRGGVGFHSTGGAEGARD